MNRRYHRASIAAVFFLLLAPSLMAAAPSALAAASPREREGVIDQCDNGASSKSYLFQTPGNVTDCYLSLDNHAVVDDAWVDLTLQGTRTSARTDPFDRTPDAFPQVPYLDVSNNGTREWAFNTSRIGSLGHTTKFLDGSSSKSMTLEAGQEGALSFEIPSAARIRNATITLSGDPVPYWAQSYEITDTTNDKKSAEGPSMAAFKGKLYAAWSTNDGNLVTGGPDLDVVVRSYDGSTWSDVTNLAPPQNQDVDDDREVVLIVYRDQLWAIWSHGTDDGVEGITNLTFRTTDDGVDWSALGSISRVGTDGINTYHQAVVYNNRLWIEWKTTDSVVSEGASPPNKDVDIVVRWYDGLSDQWGSITELTAPDNDTLDWISDIRAFQGKLYVAWEATNYDPYNPPLLGSGYEASDILMRVYDGANWGPIQVPTSQIDADEGINIEDSAPRFAVYLNPISGLDELYLSWMRGESKKFHAGQDYDIAYRVFNGAAWTKADYLTELNDDDDDMFPCMTEYNGVFYTFWVTGVNTSVVSSTGRITLIATYGDIVYRAYNGREWSPITEVTPLGNLDNASHPSCTVYNDRLYAAWESPTNQPVGGPAWDVTVRNIDFKKVELTGVYGGISENYSAPVGLGFNDTPYPFNLTELNSLLGNEVTWTDEYGNNLSRVDLKLRSQNPATIDVTSIDIRYDLSVRVNITQEMNRQLAAQKGDLYSTHYVRIPLTLGMEGGAGRITIDQVQVRYRIDYPPELLQSIASIKIDEDSGIADPIDLNQFFTDDWDAGHLRFAMSNATNTQHVLVELQGSSLKVGTLTANWCGVATFMVWAYDRNDYYATSNEVTVFVTCINDPPILEEIPDQNLTADRVFRGDVSAFDPDVGDLLTYSSDSPWVTVDAITGAYLFGDKAGTPDEVHFNITVMDLAGANDTKNATFHIFRTTVPPVGTGQEEGVGFPYWLLLLLLGPIIGYASYRVRAWRIQSVEEAREQLKAAEDNEALEELESEP